VKIVVEFKPVPSTIDKVRQNRRKIVEAVEKALLETKLLQEEEFSAYLTFQ